MNYDAEHLPFCRRYLATSRLDDCAARDAGLTVFNVGAAQACGLRRFSFASQAIAVARLAARAAEIASASQRS
jgi:hypothetical protein